MGDGGGFGIFFGLPLGFFRVDFAKAVDLLILELGVTASGSSWEMSGAASALVGVWLMLPKLHRLAPPTVGKPSESYRAVSQTLRSLSLSSAMGGPIWVPISKASWKIVGNPFASTASGSSDLLGVP